MPSEVNEPVDQLIVLGSLGQGVHAARLTGEGGGRQAHESLAKSLRPL